MSVGKRTAQNNVYVDFPGGQSSSMDEAYRNLSDSRPDTRTLISSTGNALIKV